MSKITPDRFIICSNCNIIIKKFYYEIGFSDVICVNCLCEANYGFPEGKDEYIPCKHCLEPYIRWHRTENTLGEDIDGCFIHNTKTNDSMDFDFFD